MERGGNRTSFAAPTHPCTTALPTPDAATEDTHAALPKLAASPGTVAQVEHRHIPFDSDAMAKRTERLGRWDWGAATWNVSHVRGAGLPRAGCSDQLAKGHPCRKIVTNMVLLSCQLPHMRKVVRGAVQVLAHLQQPPAGPVTLLVVSVEVRSGEGAMSPVWRALLVVLVCSACAAHAFDLSTVESDEEGVAEVRTQVPRLCLMAPPSASDLRGCGCCVSVHLRVVVLSVVCVRARARVGAGPSQLQGAVSTGWSITKKDKTIVMAAMERGFWRTAEELILHSKTVRADMTHAVYKSASSIRKRLKVLEEALSKRKKVSKGYVVSCGAYRAHVCVGV